VSGRVVTWSGGTIGHGELGRFALRARVPASGGSQLAFPTVQTYANGVVARWIGAPSADMPAPRITLTAARTPPPPVITTVSPPEEDDTGPTIWLLAGGLVVGLGVLGVALVRRRRS
jgi:LPXTG-motif cell wall-anchored protein